MNKLDNLLLDLKFQGYNVDIEKLYGVYFIALGVGGLRVEQLVKLSHILPSNYVIGLYSALTSQLYVRTDISVSDM